MSTLLLVGEASSPDAPAPGNGATARRDFSWKRAFERVGYDVVRADDGAGALARLGQMPPDLIVLAGAVPDMDLLDLCGAVRREPAAERIPFVLVASAAEKTGRAASRMGADLVFPPTVSPTEIADRLRRFF